MKYRVTAMCTIGVHTEVEATSEEEAIKIAESREVATLTIHAFASDKDEAWVTDELDGEPYNLTAFT